MLGENKIIDNRLMYRVVALRNIPKHNINVGDIGGWVEGEHNLSQEGDCWVDYEAKAFKDSKLQDNAVITDRAELFGTAIVMDNAVVGDRAKIYGRSVISGNAEIINDAVIMDGSTINGKAFIFEHAVIRGVNISGDAIIGGWADISQKENYITLHIHDGYYVTFFTGSGRIYAYGKVIIEYDTLRDVRSDITDILSYIRSTLATLKIEMMHR